MPMPAEVETCVVTWGRAFNVFGEGTTSSLTIDPVMPGTEKLVWGATGDALLRMSAAKNASDAEGESVALPVVDQPGWLDAAGHPYMDWAYKATLTWRGPSGQRQTEVKPFKVLSGQTVVDLDLIFTGHVGAPTVAPLAVVTDVAGLSGSVTKAALEGMGLGASDEGVAALVATPGTATAAAINGLIPVPAIPEATTAGLQARAENAETPLDIPTYEGSGQAVHPAVVYTPQGWNGWRYWMAMTPYPDSDAAHENPSIVVSQDGITWSVPSGLTNPVIPGLSGIDGHNSDVHLTLRGERLYMFYRVTVGPLLDEIRVTTSTDGVTWTAPALVLAGPHGNGARISPAVIWNASAELWQLWANTNNSGTDNNVVRMWTSTDVTGPWLDEGACTGFVFSANREMWHLDVHEHGGEYVMFYQEGPNGQAGVGTLRRAVSRDGLNWSPDALPVLAGVNDSGNTTGGVSKWDRGIYRASALPAQVKGSAGYAIWYSAHGPSGWRIGFTYATLIDPDAPPAEMVAAVTPARPWIAGDVFNRPDNATTLGSLTSGQSWTQHSGALGVQSGQLYAPTVGNNIATIDAGTGDVEVSMVVTNATDSVNLMFRCGANPVTSNWKFATNGTPMSAWTLSHYDGDTTTFFGSVARPVQSGDIMKVRAKGDRVQAFVNDVLAWDVRSTFNMGATRVGVQATNVAVRVRDFMVRGV